MKIGILGTRGIPNHYGGFEQFAEFLSEGLALRGAEVYVYNSHNHPYKEKKYGKVNIIHCYDPEDRIGTAGQFIYDLNCILDSRRRNFDILLQLGYTSNSIWWFLLPSRTSVVTNMDGLEWRRSKYSGPVRSFLRVAERLAVKSSHYLIADSIGIQTYLLQKYGAGSVFIPYGAFLFESPDETVLNEYDLRPLHYDMLIARMEPENNIDVILDGFVKAEVPRQFLVVGDYTRNPYGREVYKKYHSDKIIFTGSLYDQPKLNSLRWFSNLYFHGHTVGGTNPSLLEAMASSALICAHNNDFNRAILGEEGFYFSDTEEVAQHIRRIRKDEIDTKVLDGNREKIKSLYSWEKIVEDYYQYLRGTLERGYNN